MLLDVVVSTARVEGKARGLPMLEMVPAASMVGENG